MEFTINTNEGEYDLSAGVRLIGDDILVAIWGGEKPHIGAVAVGQAGPSLKDPNIINSSASVICYFGHKEHLLAKTAAEALAAALNTHVVVTAGIHWDNLSKEDIRLIMTHSDILINLIMKRLRLELRTKL
jgi:hypothetical protein